MSLTHLRLEAVDPRTAERDVLQAVALYREALRRERLPDDPPWNIETLVTEMRQSEPDEDVRLFLVNDGGTLAGAAWLYMFTAENIHLGSVNLSVRASYRRRGLGRRLLTEVVARAEAHGRTKLIGSTSDRVPSGEAFLRAMGADAALSTHTSQLDVSAPDWKRLDRWVDEGQARASDYTLWLNDGLYPAGRLAAIADLWNVMNTAPRGILDVEDSRMTVERLERGETQLALTGERRTSAFAEHRETGELVGYSELSWQPGRGSLLFQGATGVRPEHRGHGLGQWLKAANLRAALAANPQARAVRTGNADVNAAMLTINRTMGFTPFMVQTNWQVETARVRAWLDARS